MDRPPPPQTPPPPAPPSLPLFEGTFLPRLSLAQEDLKLKTIFRRLWRRCTGDHRRRGGVRPTNLLSSNTSTGARQPVCRPAWGGGFKPGLHSAGAAIGRGGRPTPHSSTCRRGQGSAQPEIWAGSLLGGSHVGWGPRSLRRAAIRWGGGAGGVRVLYICIQLYTDELSPTNPLIPSITLAPRI